MRTSDQVDKLIPAMLLARGKMKPAFKGKKNDHFKYAYANEEAWHDSVQPCLLDHDLLLSFSVSEYSRTNTLTMVKGSARVTHSSGQWLEVDGVGEGEDKADKAAYKAQTGLKKYLYALAFALPTSDDPEDDAHDKTRAKEEAKREIVKAAKGGATGDVGEAAPDQGAINAALVEQGHSPEINQEDKIKAKALFEEMKALGKVAHKKAQLIAHNCGTDYRQMCLQISTAIHEELEGAAT